MCCNKQGLNTLVQEQKLMGQVAYGTIAKYWQIMNEVGALIAAAMSKAVDATSNFGSLVLCGEK